MSIEVLYNDSQLVEELKKDCEQSFTSLYLHYAPQLYQRIRALVKDDFIAEEIIQESFVKIWQKRQSLGSMENFAGYLQVVGQNLLHEYFRKIKRDEKLYARFKQNLLLYTHQIEELLLEKHSEQVLHKAMQMLPPKQREVFEMIKIQGSTYKEVASALRISPFTVKEYLVNANKTLRKYFTDHPEMLMSLIAVKIWHL